MTKDQLNDAILSLNNVVNVTEEQTDMMIALVNMRSSNDKNFKIQRIKDDVQWELLRR